MKLLPSGLVALTLLPLSIHAHAADMKLPTKAPPPTAEAAPPALPAPGDWSGFYLGVNGGVANSHGVLMGGTAGYNYQSGPLVLGIEGDVDATWANINAPYLDTVRGRVGFAFNQMLAYFTGGWAYGDDHGSGSVIGGGIEVKLTPAISVKAEYLHVDIDGPADIVRLGLNWRFSMPGPLGTPIATRD